MSTPGSFVSSSSIRISSARPPPKNVWNISSNFPWRFWKVSMNKCLVVRLMRAMMDFNEAMDWVRSWSCAVRKRRRSSISRCSSMAITLTGPNSDSRRRRCASVSLIVSILSAAQADRLLLFVQLVQGMPKPRPLGFERADTGDAARLRLLGPHQPLPDVPDGCVEGGHARLDLATLVQGGGPGGFYLELLRLQLREPAFTDRRGSFEARL